VTVAEVVKTLAEIVKTLAEIVKDLAEIVKDQHQKKSGTGFNFCQMSHAELLTGTFYFLRTFLGCRISGIGAHVLGRFFLDCSHGRCGYYKSSFSIDPRHRF